jgi:fructokinase
MQKEKYTHILCFGEVLWDMLPSGEKPGGAPLNVAIHLKRQGIKPSLISKTGSDEGGDKLRAFLIKSKLNTELIQNDNKLATSKVLVHLDVQKNAPYEICEPVAWDNILFTPQVDKVAKEADLVIYGSLASRNKTTRETLFQILESSNATRLVDINLRAPYDKQEWIEELLQISDFAKLNDDELIKISNWSGISGSEKELIIWFAKHFNCPTICVTRGSKGAIIYSNENFYEHTGFKVDAVDTVGAGDSFLASLVASLSKNTQPEKALELACATGAFVASQSGAVPTYSEKEITQIINSANK